MLKLLLCLATSTLLGVMLLQLRQQHLELNYQTNMLHGDIERHRAKLWNQQLQIAVYTAPNAIQKTVGDRDLNMVPQSTKSVNQSNWLDTHGNPDAE